MSSTHRHNRITIKTPSDPVMLTSGRFSAQQHVKFRLHVFNNRPSASCTGSVPGLARFSDLNIFDENLISQCAPWKKSNKQTKKKMEWTWSNDELVLAFLNKKGKNQILAYMQAAAGGFPVVIQGRSFGHVSWQWAVWAPWQSWDNTWGGSSS